jgi:hypothetical protein
MVISGHHEALRPCPLCPPSPTFGACPCAFGASLTGARLTPLRHLQRDQARQQGRGIELADHGFQVAQAARDRMQRKYVAIAGRRQRHEAETDQLCFRWSVGL